jgi:hypothetical protein
MKANNADLHKKKDRKLTFRNIFIKISPCASEYILGQQPAKPRRIKMKTKHLFLAAMLLMATLIAISCKVGGGDDGDGDIINPPNFVSDPCGGCPKEENIGSVTGIRFFSYVKNNGGAGIISMTINPGNGSTTQEFNVTAGTSYVFQASVPVEVNAASSFTYSAKFPGSPGYTDTHEDKNGFHVTGAPFDLQLNPK